SNRLESLMGNSSLLEGFRCIIYVAPIKFCKDAVQKLWFYIVWISSQPGWACQGSFHVSRGVQSEAGQSILLVLSLREPCRSRLIRPFIFHLSILTGTPVSKRWQWSRISSIRI